MRTLLFIWAILFISPLWAINQALVDSIWFQPLKYPQTTTSDSCAIWDFSSLEDINKPIELVEYCISLDSLHITKSFLHSHQHFVKNGDFLFLVAEETFKNRLNFVDSITLCKLPLALNASLLDTFTCHGEYRHYIPFQYQGIYQTETKSGVIILPNGFCDTVLHVYRTCHLLNNDTMETIIKKQQWYLTNYPYPIVEAYQLLIADSVHNSYAYYHVPDTILSNKEKNDAWSIQEQQIESVDSIITNICYAPNPVSSHLQISYELHRTAKVYFSLHYEGGVCLYRSPMYNQEQGVYQQMISMQHLPMGAYVLYVYADDTILSTPIIKQ